jgi:hypothetical protein
MVDPLDGRLGLNLWLVQMNLTIIGVSDCVVPVFLADRSWLALTSERTIPKSPCRSKFVRSQTGEPVVDPVQRPIVTPLVEVEPDGAPGWEVEGQVAPLAAGAEEIQDGVEYVAQVGLAGHGSQRARSSRTTRSGHTPCRTLCENTQRLLDRQGALFVRSQAKARNPTAKQSRCPPVQ